MQESWQYLSDFVDATSIVVIVTPDGHVLLMLRRRK